MKIFFAEDIIVDLRGMTFKKNELHLLKIYVKAICKTFFLVCILATDTFSFGGTLICVGYKECILTV
jgi:hypothetical protein